MPTISEAKVLITAQDSASATIKGVGGSFDSLGTKLTSLTKNIGLMVAAFAGAAAVGSGIAAIKIGKDSILSAATYEQTIQKFETLMGSGEKAKIMLKDLTSFAAKTPFELKDLEGQAVKLMAYGFTAEEIIPTLSSLGDVTSLLGTEKLPFLTLALGQVKTAGKLMGTEVRQFSENGVPLIDMLSQSMNKSKEEILGMVTAGEIGYPEVQKAINLATQEGGRFHEGMEKQSKTVLGMWSNLQDAWEGFKRIFGAKLLDPFKPLLTSIMPLAQTWLPIIAEWLGTKLSTFIETKLIPSLKNLWIELKGVDWAGMITTLEGYKATWDRFWDTIQNKIIPALRDYLLPKLQEFWAVVKEKLWPSLQELWTALQPLLPIIGVALVVALGSLIDYLTQTANNVSNLIAVFAWILTSFQKLNDACVALFNTIRDFVIKAFDWIVQKIQEVGGWLEGFAIKVGEVMQKVGDFFKAGWDAIFSVISWYWMNNIEPVLLLVEAVFLRIFYEIYKKAEENFTAMWNKITEIWNNIYNTVSPIVQNIYNYLAGKMDEIKMFVTGKWDEIKTAAKEIWDAIAGRITGPLDAAKMAITTWGTDIWTLVTGKWDEIKTWFENRSDSFRDALVKPFKEAKEKIEGWADAIRNAAKKINPFYKESPSLVELVQKGVTEINKAYGSIQPPQFSATEMIAGRQSIGTNGSVGGGEKTGATINISINNPIVRDATDVQAIANAVARIFSRDLESEKMGLSTMLPH